VEVLLAVCAFWLGACPFSVWVGRWLLGKDVRDYGDGNPGGTNVLRAGGRKSFCLAAFLDMAKGAPFVILANSLFGFHEAVVLAVGLCAILGSAFSPLLGLRGGKSIGVTFGVLFALLYTLPQHYMMLFTFVIFMLLGFLFIEIDAWIVMLGPAGSAAYLAATGNSWESLFMLCVLAILAAKHFDELKVVPRFRGRLVRWLYPIKRQI